ncbi:hypothetical protein GQ42DRAFT_158369 [Ramicandelaber brevisporus]|nr:hypothetical protein GQ42DRAFT_158369 [Ramicandelaber brevisporus]
MLAQWLWSLYILANLASIGAFASTLILTLSDKATSDANIIIYAFLAAVAFTIVMASYNISSWWWRGGVQRLLQQKLATTVMAFLGAGIFAAGTGFLYQFGRMVLPLWAHCNFRMRKICEPLKAFEIMLPVALAAWGLVFLLCLGSYFSSGTTSSDPEKQQSPGPHPPPGSDPENVPHTDAVNQSEHQQGPAQDQEQTATPQATIPDPDEITPVHFTSSKI